MWECKAAFLALTRRFMRRGPSTHLTPHEVRSLLSPPCEDSHRCASVCAALRGFPSDIAQRREVGFGDACNTPEDLGMV